MALGMISPTFSELQHDLLHYPRHRRRQPRKQPEPGASLVTATQAPTPGPLTAAIDMLSEARDFIDRFSDVRDGDYGTSEPNAAMVMVHEINATIDQISAPTAPVEASGSEDMRRREITAVMTALDRFHVLAGRVTATQAEHVLASLDALRPQPSGETR